MVSANECPALPKSSRPSIWLVRGMRSLCAAAMLNALSSAASPAGGTSGPQLPIEERAFIAEQKAFGHNRVPMVIAARTGRNARVAALIRSLGGEVAGRADAINYLYVIVPIGQLA